MRKSLNQFGLNHGCPARGLIRAGRVPKGQHPVKIELFDRLYGSEIVEVAGERGQSGSVKREAAAAWRNDRLPKRSRSR